MILFDQLRITDDGKMLLIDVHVNESDYFKDIYLDKVYIQTSEQVSEADPLSPGDDCIYQMTVSGNQKGLHLALKAQTDFDKVYTTLSDKLLFVYVVCKGVADPCTPCRLDELTTLGVTFDETLFYQQVMQYTRELADNCEIPKDFIDMILLWNGFKAAVDTEHYIPAIDFWKKMFGERGIGKTNAYRTKGCGCS